MLHSKSTNFVKLAMTKSVDRLNIRQSSSLLLLLLNWFWQEKIGMLHIIDYGLWMMCDIDFESEWRRLIDNDYGLRLFNCLLVPVAILLNSLEVEVAKGKMDPILFLLVFKGRIDDYAYALEVYKANLCMKCNDVTKINPLILLNFIKGFCFVEWMCCFIIAFTIRNKHL